MLGVTDTDHVHLHTVTLRKSCFSSLVNFMPKCFPWVNPKMFVWINTVTKNADSPQSCKAAFQHIHPCVLALVLNEMCLTLLCGKKSQTSELEKTTLSTCWRQMFSLYLLPLLFHLSLFCLLTVIIAERVLRQIVKTRLHLESWFFNLKPFYINTLMSLCQAWQMTVHRRINRYFHMFMSFFTLCRNIIKFTWMYINTSTCNTHAFTSKHPH